MSTIKVDTIVDEDGSGAPNFTHGATGIAGLTPSIDDNGNATAITIDSSENVLVGKTSTGYNSGTEISYEDFIRVNRTNGSALYVGRNSSDGELVSFRKDGSTVGSIGTKGDQLYIGTGDTGLKFLPSSDSVVGATSVDGSGRDGAIDLGLGGSRFKDLYLSGGVFLGGTGAANKLDDYEEGTWTPAVSNMTVTGTLTTAGRYTKVGRMVSIMGWIKAATSIAHGSSALISGFPFAGATVTGEQQSRSAGVIAAGAFTDLPSSNHSPACFVDSPNSRAFLGNFTTTAANEYIYINAVYYTA